jgi:hypothetical protein
MAVQQHVSSMFFSSWASKEGLAGSSMVSSPIRRTNLVETWMPLNPSLAHRYYDTYKSNCLIQACFKEKIRAGFSGGFDVEYGPEGNRTKLSSATRPSRRVKRSVKSGKSKLPSVYGGDVVGTYHNHTSETSQKEQKQWIEDLMKKAEMYRDVLGIVAFKPTITPMGEVRFEIVDITLGYFVSRITEDHVIEYGFRYYQSSGVSGIFPTVGSNPNTASSIFIRGGAAQHEPDPSVHVYTWPGYEPDVGSQSPFKSTMSVLYRNALETAEMMDNEMIGHYKMTHPTFVTEPVAQHRLPADQTEHEILLDVAGSLKPNESQSYFYKKRVNEEMAIHLSNTMRTINDKIMTKKRRVIGLNLDGTETTVARYAPWQDNMYIAPVGTKVTKGPDAKIRGDIIPMLRFKAAEIATVFAVPLPGILGVGGTGSGGGRQTSTGARSEYDMFRRTLIEMRNSMTRFFESAYMAVVAKAENFTLSSILTDINVGKSNEESMVRSYVRNVLKRGDGQGGTSGRYDVQDGPSIDRTRGGRGGADMGALSEIRGVKGKGKDGKTSVEEVTIEEAERQREDAYQLELEKAAYTRAEENRKIYGDGSSNEPAVAQGVRMPQTLDRPMRRSSWAPAPSPVTALSKLKHTDDPVGVQATSGRGQFTPGVEEWATPVIPRSAMAGMDRYEREIADQISHQKYLEKIEKAKWHRFMQDQNQMEQRISRIMYTALTNYGVTLNPDAIRRCLKKEIQGDPALSNTFGAEIKDPNDIVEDFLVGEMMTQRKGYLTDLLGESKRIRIVWNSTPMPDLEILVSAHKEGIGVPSEMVVDIIAEQMGLVDRLEHYRKREKVHDREIEAYAKKRRSQLTALGVKGGDPFSMSSTSPSSSPLSIGKNKKANKSESGEKVKDK